MIQSIIYATESGNLYVYDDQYSLSLLIHPEFRKVHEKLTDTDQYYLKKYEYLRGHGFFSKSKCANFVTVSESMVKNSIIQTKQISFEVTDSCNLNCTYCNFGGLYEGFDARNHRNINTNNAIILLKYIFDHKFNSKNNKLFISFYGGEPLLNINFIKQIVKVVKQLNSEKELDIEYSMTTNATLIYKYIDFLVANKFKLLISLDGNKENHSYRIYSKNKQNSFQKVIENLDRIQRDYSEYFIHNIRFNAVLHNRNSVKEIYEFIYKRYRKIPKISELNPHYVNPDKINDLNRMFHRKRESEAEYQKEESDLLQITHHELLLYKELQEFLRFYSINFYTSNIYLLLHKEEKYLPTSTCLPFGNRIFLTNRNKLLPCEKVNFKKYAIGEVNRNVIIDIPEITRQYNFYYDQLKKVCQYCYSYRFCGICMFFIKNLDKLDTEEFVCDNFYDQKAFQNKLYRIFSFFEKYPEDFFKIFEIK